MTQRSKPERKASSSRGSQTLARGWSSAAAEAVAYDPDLVRPPTREELAPVLMGALLLAFLTLMLCFTRGYVLLYGDAVAHLGIARRIFDSRNPGLVQLGGPWLPLPHLLMLPFVQRMEWWQSGLAGTWPSLGCYILGVAGFYKLCRRMLVPRWALVATAFYGLNPNLLYLATTAMTEPLFLALMIWLTLLTMECVDAIKAEQAQRAAWRLIALGLLIFAAVLTRYDGWVLGAVAWCVVTWQLSRAEATRRRVSTAFLAFTLLAVAGPLLWLWYNQHFYHDPLDFLRGPYSAPAIERRTAPPGSQHYRGWHSPGWALLLYTRAAQLDAAAWETGFAVMAAALAGVWIAVRRRSRLVSLLLWMPLAFYVYSIAYGSVPIFLPQLWPHSYYNSRYGMELLPALALFACIAASELEQRLKQSRVAEVGAAVLDSTASLTAPNSTAPSPDAPPLASAIRIQPVFLAALAFALINPVAMIYAPMLLQQIASRIERRPSNLLADYGPLVLKEAMANSTTRVPFERNLALVLEDLPPGAPILMQESDHIGALQDAGIPLQQTINETDYDSWKAALNDPADHVAYVVALEGDAVAQAVAAHPADLQELTILCGTGQPCARIYQSDRYGMAGRTTTK